ncbi:hypothetical protein AM609_13755 [Actinomyces sp. oral taxon 414]|uniref:hypothetical protein n=1 Tax=Actinomyces sp. oral taxon 414 TaxID=712122 RepID=UPI0006AE7BC8|nr:hypothetical protein [Actinomyces sp. oral taxon 414]ALD00235.1 hypothetical protein AM609_13755 [Actinomyces sp. oral taxon 414]
MLSLLCTLQIVAAQIRDRAGARLRREEGASTVEWVIITGFLIVLAAVVGRIIYGLVQDAGDKLKVPSIGP